MHAPGMNAPGMMPMFHETALASILYFNTEVSNV